MDRFRVASVHMCLCRRPSALALALTLALPTAAGMVPVGCASNANHDAITQGAKAPALRTTAHDGTVVDTTALAGKPMLVYFYPKDATPGCTAEACAFRDVWARYEEAGVVVVGVSADSNASHREFAAEHQLPFPLVADEELTWAKAFGVGTMMGMTRRQSVLIAPDGTIARIYRDVDPGVHAEEVLRDAAGLTQAQP